ncbi:UNVERIFIED_CONTAM: hypothetical protein ABIC26_003264 [Paenibacillus sp. PvR008]
MIKQKASFEQLPAELKPAFQELGVLQASTRSPVS